MANKIVPQTLNSSGVYDKLITAISSGGTGAESESTAVKNLINGLSSTTPDSNDLIPFQDVSSGGAGKTTLSALASALQSVRGYAKIQTGSYVGTGTYGADNPCSLTFNFIPKYFYVYHIGYISGGRYYCEYCFNLESNEYLYFCSTKSSEIALISLSKSEATFSWYALNAINQLNKESNQYLYYVLG